MRVCPKCGYIDPPYWKHVKYSYWIDSCSLENFKILSPLLAKKFTKAKSIIEDDLYVYRLCKNGDWVERRAKIDFVSNTRNYKDWRDKTEKPKLPQSPYHRDWNLSQWRKWHPNQRKIGNFLNVETDASK